jgi:hypothetical protein
MDYVLLTLARCGDVHSLGSLGLYGLGIVGLLLFYWLRTRPGPPPPPSHQ